MIKKSEVPKDMLVVDGIEDLKSNLMMKCIDGHLGQISKLQWQIKCNLEVVMFSYHSPQSENLFQSLAKS